MSRVNQGVRDFSLCLHIRKISYVLIHRANAREPTNPADLLAALRPRRIPVCPADSLNKGDPMISEEKIKIMTNLAMFEKHEGKKILPAARYFKSDYISSKLFRSFFSYTLSFALCLSLWGLYHMEYWLNNLEPEKLTQAGIWIGTIYCAGLVVYLLISAYVYLKRYEYASRGVKVYLGKLKKLDKRYGGTSRPVKRTKGGRTS